MFTLAKNVRISQLYPDDSWQQVLLIFISLFGECVFEVGRCGVVRRIYMKELVQVSATVMVVVEMLARLTTITSFNSESSEIKL